MANAAQPGSDQQKDRGEVRLAEAIITDQMMADMAAKAELALRIDHSVWNEEATTPAARRLG